MAILRFGTFFTLLSAALIGSAQHVAYEKRKVNGIWFHAVIANLKSDDVKVSGAVNRRIGKSELFNSMIAQAQPTVAISGTFFNVASSLPVGSIVIEGSRVVEGLRGSCLAIDYFNRARILDPMHGKRVNTNGYRFLVRGGVRILNAGKMHIYPQAQKFKDARIWSTARRAAVGVTRNNKIIFLATNKPALLRDVVSAMKVFGARDAIALDGGSSAALYYKGRFLVSPKRKLTNIVTIYEAPGAAWATLPTISR